MALQVSIESIGIFNKIKDSINDDPKNYVKLNLRCYLCENDGHIAIDCSKFNKIKSNLKTLQKRLTIHKSNKEVNQS